MTKSLSNILKTSSNILSANSGGTGLTSVGNTGNVLTSTGSGWISSVPFSYTLPTANTTTLGGVKVDGTTIIANNGVISGASVTNAVTFNNGGEGAVSGTTFNGAAAITISYNSIGASPVAGSSNITTIGTVTSGTSAGITGGAANTIVYQTALNTTSFIAAPTTANTVLQWNGSQFQWVSISTLISGAAAYSAYDV